MNPKKRYPTPATVDTMRHLVKIEAPCVLCSTMTLGTCLFLPYQGAQRPVILSLCSTHDMRSPVIRLLVKSVIVNKMAKEGVVIENTTSPGDPGAR